MSIALILLYWTIEIIVKIAYTVVQMHAIQIQFKFC